MLMLECVKNKLAKHRGNPHKKDEYYCFWRLFGQCLANVWPFALKSPQTASDGVVCLAKCKLSIFNTLIINTYAALQRGRVLKLYKHLSHQISARQTIRICLSR